MSKANIETEFSHMTEKYHVYEYTSNNNGNPKVINM